MVKIGVPAETFPGERRVAMTPRAMDMLAKSGVELAIESGAGAAAGFPDDEYRDKGARLVERAEVFSSSDVILEVRTAGAVEFRSGQIVIGFGEPLSAVEEYAQLAARGVTSFAMELVPRITRAQSMDALSSMATIAGYK